MRDRLPLPARIQNAPELQLGLELYFLAFFELSSCRPIGMDEGPIPWIAIWDYCERLGIEGDQRDDMFYHIRSMDNAYFQYKSSKRPKGMAAGKGVRQPLGKGKARG